MDTAIKLENPCATRRDFCVNCHSHFMAVRPFIKEVVVTKRFLKDLNDEEKAKSIVKDVLDCSNVDFSELHKYEESVDGNMIFRAKKEGTHIVYGVDKRMRIIFLRALKNYSEYRQILEDKKEVRRMITRV